MTITLEAANARRARIAEINAILEDREPELHTHKSVVDNWQSQIGNLELELEKEEHRTPHEVRFNAMGKDEKRKKQAQLRHLKEQHDDAMKVYEPVRKELSDLAAELESLEKNAPELTMKDLKSAGRLIDELELKIEQTEQAAEKAQDKALSSETKALADNVATLTAELDLMAADLDMGNATEADIKKHAAKLAKAEKELAAAQDLASKSESAQRGYQLKLDRLTDELGAARSGFEVMLTLFARNSYQGEAKRLQAALDTVNDTLESMALFNELSRNHGDGSELFTRAASVRIEPEGLLGFDNQRLEPDTDKAREKADQILESLTAA